MTEFLAYLSQTMLEGFYFFILTAPFESSDWTVFRIILNTVWHCKFVSLNSCRFLVRSIPSLLEGFIVINLWVPLNLFNAWTLFRIKVNTVQHFKFLFRIISNTVWLLKFHLLIGAELIADLFQDPLEGVLSSICGDPS